jgi:hypothetical protein
VTVGSAVVPPGRETTVRLTLETRSAAPVVAGVELVTNDPATPVAFLTIGATAADKVAVTPDRVFFRADRGAVPVQLVSLVGPPDMELREAVCLADQFAARISARGETARERRWEIALTLRGDAVGEVRDELQVRTSDATRPLIVVPLGGTVRGDLELRPSGLFWGFATHAELSERTVRVRSRSGTRFAVRGVSCADPRVMILPARQTSPSSWEIEVTLGPQEAGVIDARMVVATDVPGEEELLVQLYADVVDERPPQ